MTRLQVRLQIALFLAIITPLGLLSKLYAGPGHQWCNHYAGGLIYEIFWCLCFFWLFPTRKAVSLIPFGVFGVTCVLEVLQLWQTPTLQIRSTLVGRLLLGTTFSWWDFPHYFFGCVLNWLWLRKVALQARGKEGNSDKR